MSNCMIETSSAEQQAVYPMMNIHQGNCHGAENNRICPKFVKLLFTDHQLCDDCPNYSTLAQDYNQYRELYKRCLQTDCLGTVKVCKEYTCRKNLFNGLKKIPLETDISKIMRNCMHGLILTGPMTLEEVGSIYGLSRERCRQIEIIFKIKLGRWIMKSPELSLYIPRGGEKYFKDFQEEQRKKREMRDTWKNAKAVLKKEMARNAKICGGRNGDVA